MRRERRKLGNPRVGKGNDGLWIGFEFAAFELLGNNRKSQEFVTWSILFLGCSRCQQLAP